MDCSPPSSSVHGTEKWSGVGCHFLLQRIFPTQGSNTLLQHQQVDYLPLGHQGRQKKKCQHSLVCCLKCFFQVFNMEKLIYKTWLCLALDKPLSLLSFHFLIYKNRAWSIYLLISSHCCFLMDLCGSLCLISDAWLFFPVIKLHRPMSL